MNLDTINKLKENLDKSVVLTHSFDPIILLDLDMHILSYNEEFSRVLFANKDNKSTLTGKSIRKIGFKNLEKLLTSFIEDEEDSRIDSSLSMSDPEPRIFDVKLSRIYDKNRNSIGVIVFLKEITFEFERERRLWQSNEELSILYEISQAEVQSLKYDEILHNVLARFSEMTNLSKGMYLHFKPEKTGFLDIVNFNLSEEELDVLKEHVDKDELPDNFFLKRSTKLLKTVSEKHDFYKSAKKLGFEGAISIPIYVKDRILGTLLFFNEEDEHVHISTNMRFYDLIGQQIGLALEKAKLFNELEKSFKEIEKKNKKFSDELALAQKMQKGILSLNFPKKPGVNFAVKYIPSYHLSGDFYDIFEITGNQIGVLIADVCGHGIDAALVTSFLKASVRDLSQDFLHPDQLLSNLNKKLYELLEDELFVTAYYLILDLENKIIRYSNAGHPYPLFFKGKDASINELKVDGTLLSVMKDSEYSVCERSYENGDRVFLYTDGIFDLKNKDGEFIPRKYITDLMEKFANLNGHKLIEAILSRLYKFSETDQFDDDINLIVVDFY
ncbi:MAG: SpoIIE family protein phosphatase [Spirochaetes bacterium]|nr:SpoIIE family protein phosphatase [Spirochaetota bacterium]